MKSNHYSQWESTLVSTKLTYRTKYQQKGIQFIFRVKSSKELIKRTFSLSTISSPKSILNKWLNTLLSENNTDQLRSTPKLIMEEIQRQATGSNYLLTLDNSKDRHIDIIGEPEIMN